jgi:glycosyltransferase involved in cell wall biosynthesis
MMQSRPVICSRVGGMPEVVIDNETGLLYPPGDEHAMARAIDRLASDWDLAQRLGLEGRRQALEKYTLRKHVDDVMAVYARCRTEFESRSLRVSLPLAEQNIG